MNKTGFNSYSSILIIVNKLIIRLYTVMMRQIIIMQTLSKVPLMLSNKSKSIMLIDMNK